MLFYYHNKYYYGGIQKFKKKKTINEKSFYINILRNRETK